MGDEVTKRLAQLEQDGEFAEQLFTHGIGVQAAEGAAEWLHAEVRRGFGIDLDQGRRYSWGYPACPDQSEEREKVERLLKFSEIGIGLSGRSSRSTPSNRRRRSSPTIRRRSTSG